VRGGVAGEIRAGEEAALGVGFQTFGTRSEHVDAKNLVELGALALVAITVLALVHNRSRVSKGIGIRTIQFLAVPTIPAFMIVLGLEHLIDVSAIATVVGVLVGYVFSRAAVTKD
jgi:hypothetical protein